MRKARVCRGLLACLLWVAAIALTVGLQIRFFRMRYYEPLPREKIDDPLAKYLPRKKK